ncbi:uncharacterized protein LOC131607480 isoform X2 [Vicia villosa]|uniref:uncharacterized protein LOC131607480 isoform X2 n=1 Tax=Vicia villosa TaxID=3911 RepID=UPI00273C4F08|nr:uncharacterized protein LOC131607480 isoform X2 [Vicia villosa]
MDQNHHSESQSTTGEVSSATAVLLGALAPGVNGATWNTLKSAFLMLGLCLAVMLGLAFSSSDKWFLAETGLVSVEHQMREMGLDVKAPVETDKKGE